MSELAVFYNCPKCGGDKFEHPADLKVGDMITCISCGEAVSYEVMKATLDKKSLDESADFITDLLFKE